MASFRSIATVPAAGRSRRMGKPKLLLPVAGVPLIDRILEAWTASQVDHVVVVVRRDDRQLIERCRQFPVELVLATPPPRDMRASIERAVDRAVQRFLPAEDDAWLVAPADLPALSAPLIDHLLGEYRPPSSPALVPVVGEHRGHPVLLPWKHAAGLRNLRSDAGLNELVRQVGHRSVRWHDQRLLDDLDTLDDYRRATGEIA